MSLTTHSSPDSFDRHAAEAVMAWHGWGSPIGLSIALIAVGLTAVLLRFAVFGF